MSLFRQGAISSEMNCGQPRLNAKILRKKIIPHKYFTPFFFNVEPMIINFCHSCFQISTISSFRTKIKMSQGEYSTLKNCPSIPPGVAIMADIMSVTQEQIRNKHTNICSSRDSNPLPLHKQCH